MNQLVIHTDAAIFEIQIFSGQTAELVDAHTGFQKYHEIMHTARFCRLSHKTNYRNLHFKKLLSKCQLDTLEQAFDTLEIGLLNTQS